MGDGQSGRRLLSGCLASGSIACSAGWRSRQQVGVGTKQACGWVDPGRAAVCCAPLCGVGAALRDAVLGWVNCRCSVDRGEIAGCARRARHAWACMGQR
jgi:hypothetical protein